jgi:NAD(P) transhydrogenase subunit beta
VSHTLTAFLYLVSSVCFIMALRGLSSPETARQGNLYGIFGIALAIITTLFNEAVLSYETIFGAILIGGGIGTIIARKIKMTALPQLVAAFHSLVGLAAVLVAASALYSPDVFKIGGMQGIKLSALVEMGLGSAIGAITFTGSIVAFGKLQGFITGKPLTFTGQHFLNLLIALAILGCGVWLATEGSFRAFWILTLLSFLLGFMLILPIGGADMPVIVSMLNSYSGWAACGIGFTLQNHLLIITGALVGSSGAILSYIMCKGMNRSIISVMLGGFGAEASGGAAGQSDGEERPVKSGSAEDAAFLMKNAGSVVIVPGYGMAVAQAQHSLKEMVDMLKKAGVKVRFAIHPVAGRMPGHMNVLLAEANVPYEDVLELDEINRDFTSTDVAFVIGANDVTNPSAKTDPQSPIYGMPILDVESAKTILFVKRSMSAGYAGVQNELFFRDNTMMLFSDAKKMCEQIIKAL